MPSQNSLKWPSEYIENAQIPVTTQSFNEAVLTYGPAKDALELMDRKELELLLARLVRITSDFKKQDIGIRAMRQARVLQNIDSSEKFVQRDQKLSDFYRLLEGWVEDGSPWQMQYARSLLHRTNSLKHEATQQWLRRIRVQKSWGKLNRKKLNQEFTAHVERIISRCLQAKKVGGKSLGKKKKQQYTHALVFAVMRGAQEIRLNLDKTFEQNRVRTLRSISKKGVRPKAGELGSEDSEEFTNYTQVGLEYMRKLTTKKQKVAGRSQK